MEGKAATHAKAAAAEVLRARLYQLHQPHIESRFSLRVIGNKLRHLWSNSPALPYKEIWGDETCFALEVPSGRGTLVVVEFADGQCAPIQLYDELSAIVLRSHNAVSAVAYDGEDNMFRRSTEALIELTQGIRNPARMKSVADEIRRSKHANPVLGAIAAYLYRGISDVDNIRRMAYYYALKRQPVPFDIALLGEMPVEPDGSGGYIVRVPAVARRPDNLDSGDSPQFTWEDTPEIAGLLGGCCPWLTMGWDYPPNHSFQAQAHRQDGMAAGLVRPSTFTLLDASVGARLARDWGLHPS